MPPDTLFNLLHRVAVVGDATPNESFLVMSYLAIAVFALFALVMLLNNHASNQRIRAARRDEHIIKARYIRM